MLRFSQLPLSLRTAGCQTSSRLWATDSRCSAAQGTPTWKHFSVDLWTFLKVWFPHHPFLCLVYKWRFSLGSVSYEVLNPAFHRATENYRAWSGNLQGKIVVALKWWHKKCFSSRSAKIELNDYSLHPSKGIDSPYITYFSSSQCHCLWGPFRTTTSYHREHRLLPCTQICLQHIRVYLFQHGSGACLPKHVCSYSSEQVQLSTWPCHRYFFSLHPFHFLHFQLAFPMWEL